MADNKSYKDMYHFSPNYFTKVGKDRFPSLYEDEKDVKDTIKNNNERANVEIEKDEIVLTPDLSALFKARGKKHYNGGIDVILQPNSFVFSDDKALGISKEEREFFKLKEGGRPRLTPAEVVKNNIDTKHYNRIVQNLKDPYKDDLAKKSSARMLEKYMQTLGNIAFIQEKKKNFPDGLPGFVQGDIPLDKNIEETIDMQKQYAKYGGKILPKFQKGKNYSQYPVVNKFGKDYYQDENGHLIPVETVDQNQLQAPTYNRTSSGNPYLGNPSMSDTDGIVAYLGDRYNKSNRSYYTTDQWRQFANEIGYNGEQNNKAFQTWLAGDPRFSGLISGLHKQYGMPKSGTWYDGLLGHRWDVVLKNWLEGKNKPTNPITDKLQTSATPEDKQSLEPLPNLKPNQVTGNPQGNISADWDFTPWQKASMGYDAYRALSAKRYLPYRTQYNLENVNPYLVSAEQSINDMKGAANMQMNAARTMNPILANAQNSAITGDLMNRIPQVRESVNNTNAQIKNQFAQYNNQVNNSQETMNKQADQQYYQQMITGNANYDNMKQYLRDQMMSNLFKNVNDNQQLAFTLLQQDQPVYGFDFKRGELFRKPFNIKDVQTGSTQGDYQSTFLNKLIQDWDKLDNKDRINLLKIMTAKGFQPSRNGKKGGKF